MLDSQEDEDVPKKKKARTSTPKNKSRSAAKTDLQEASPNLSDFLKGHQLVKRMKLKPFDPFKGCSAQWISSFEKEFGQHDSVEDLGYTHLVHLLKESEARKWHFRYKPKYKSWFKLKKDFTSYFEKFYIDKLFLLRTKFEPEKQKLKVFVCEQMQLWSAFFPNLDQTQLNTAAVSGLTSEIAHQLSPYVSCTKEQFIEYCEMVENWKEMSLDCGNESFFQESEESEEDDSTEENERENVAEGAKTAEDLADTN